MVIQPKISLMSTMLHEWNCQMHPESRHATVFTLYFKNAARLLFADISDESTIDQLLTSDDFLDGFLRITDQVIKMPYQNYFNEALCKTSISGLNSSS